MISGIGNEAIIFLYAALSGAVVLFGYGVLRCIRKLIRHSMLAVGLEDLAFWAAASIYLFSRMYQSVQGRIRWYFIAGMLAGAAAAGMIGRVIGKICIMAEKKLEKYRKNR